MGTEQSLGGLAVQAPELAKHGICSGPFPYYHSTALEQGSKPTNALSSASDALFLGLLGCDRSLQEPNVARLTFK